MANIRSANEIIQNLVDLLKVLQPNLDTKQGTVSRDLFIEAPANQMALLYEELSKISTLQSIRLSIGTDLDKLAQNFGAKRNSAKPSTGIALLTFNSIPASVPINKGGLIFSSSGFSFSVVNSVSVDPANSNLYKSIATKYRSNLDFLGINDIYAVEVSVQASTPGTAGNIAQYNLNRTSIPSVSNVTNIFNFENGLDQEDDATFRNRVLAIFSGSNIGTALGYKNIALSDASVSDALIIEPGDPLMTRDGTVVSENSDGSFTIVSEGSGGKVDVIILGVVINEHIDSFIYHDLSNQNDPTNSKNNVVLGQIPADLNKTVSRKRIDDFKSGALPAQPVDSIISISGTLSGSNFTEKQTDELGRITGNYEIIKDTGAYAGSPFGFDQFHWISNKISNFSEDRIKANLNSQDNTTFSDVLNISQIQQNIQVSNENSIVSKTDRSSIQLLHFPATNITRVFNTNTGERYTVSSQNPDGSGNINNTGRIIISGNTLPASSDILQVDYTWIVDYDPYLDYDGKFLNDNPRIIASKSDSVDWGYNNLIRSEFINLVKDGYGSFYSGTTTHNINSIISIKEFSQALGTVSIITDPLSPIFNKKVINLNSTVDILSNIENISLYNTNKEIYNTAENDGSFSSTRVVISAQIRFNSIIVLPTDTTAQNNDYVVIRYNSSDIFTVNGNSGNFNSNQLTIPIGNTTLTNNLFLVKATYLANVQDLFSSGISSLPTSRVGNGFLLNNKVGFNNNIFSNLLRRENQSVGFNGTSFFITLSVNSSEYSLEAPNVLSVIRLSDNEEFVNFNNPASLNIDINGFYQVIFDGYNSPILNDKVLIIYSAEDLKRTQPTTFQNNIINTSLTQIKFDTINNNFYVPMHEFIEASSIKFSIIDPISDTIYASNTDGYILTNFSSTNIGFFGSFGTIFSTIENITTKQIKINSNLRNNDGIYDITNYDSINNLLTIENILTNIDPSQVDIIRIIDGQELWNLSGQVVPAQNKLILPNINFTTANDEVLIIYYEYNNLRQDPTKLIINISDQINNSGVITVNGKTLTKAKDVIFTITNNGFKIDLSDAMRSVLLLTSLQNVPSNLEIARVTLLEKVSVSSDNEVIEILNTFDIKEYSLKNNILFSQESLYNSTLSNLEFIIPNTANNISNEPKIGDVFRITFYYLNENDSENIFFTRNGTLYTNKLFSFIDTIYISSGFTKSQSAKITLSAFNQPINGSRYKIFYDYTAPKENERIMINYNYNQLITNVSFDIEAQRPINADVLVRAANKVELDLIMFIIVSPDFVNTGSSQLVVQNVKDKMVSSLNATNLGTTIDASDLINTAYSVAGVDRVRITYFNKDGNIGQVLSITAQNNQYFVANNVEVNLETR